MFRLILSFIRKPQEGSSMTLWIWSPRWADIVRMFQLSPSLSLSLSLSRDLAVSSHRLTLFSLEPTPCPRDNHMQKGRCSGKVRGCWEWQLEDMSHANALRFTHAHRQACPVPLSLCVGLPVCFTGMTVNRNLNGVRRVIKKKKC